MSLSQRIAIVSLSSQAGYRMRKLRQTNGKYLSATVQSTMSSNHPLIIHRKDREYETGAGNEITLLPYVAIFRDHNKPLKSC